MRHEVASPPTVLNYFKGRYEVADGRVQPPQSFDPAPGELTRTIEQIEQYEVIVIESNEDALFNIGHGFIEAALQVHGEAPTVPATLPAFVERLLVK